MRIPGAVWQLEFLICETTRSFPHEHVLPDLLIVINNIIIIIMI